MTSSASSLSSSTASPSTPLASWRGHSGPELDRVGEFRVVDCAACAFRHLIPIPSEAELSEVYRHEYYTRDKPLYLEHSREDRAWWNLVYRERFEAFERLLAPDRRRVLDVGSGPGVFLSVGRERGWQALGIEPSATAAAHARAQGLEVVEEFLTAELAGTLGLFDAIHMNEVLEHLPEPRAQLELCRELLGPGGLVCVAVPNDYSPFQDVLRRVCGFDPWWVAPPHHVNYFDFDSLAGLLERAGFQPLRREGTFPIDLFLLMGDDYIGKDSVGRACHEKRVAFETNLEKGGAGEIKRELYRRLAEIGLGRHVVITARRR